MKARRKLKRAGRSAVPAVPAALLAAALRAQSEGVFIAERRSGPHGLKILFANDRLCTMTGYTAAQLVGQPHGILHNETTDIERVKQWLPLAVPGQPLTGEGYLQRADGTPLGIAWSIDPLSDARGRVTHVVATYRDQTEKRHMQEALVHAQRLDAVGRLAGGVAHDFNNLLSVINGYCEILAAHVATNPQAMREVTEIHTAGRKAAALTQQLLAFSRREPLNLRVINLNDLVRSSSDILTRLVGDAGVVKFEFGAQLANVRTDPTQFQQVLLNLVLNARDALRGKGRIVVTTENRLIEIGLNRRAEDIPPGRYVAFRVADNGTGMDAETQKHLFEPFFTTKPDGKGTGLGLALVYGVVQQSGGIITVKSELLVGSNFEILLPVVRGPVEPEPDCIAPLPVTHGSETVLLIEDDEVVRKMVEGIFTADGYYVVAVDSPAAAQAALRRKPRHVRLVVAEVVGEGEKFVRRLLEAEPDLRLVCCGNRDSHGPVKGLASERQAALTKPFALSELLKVARRVLDAP